MVSSSKPAHVDTESRTLATQIIGWNPRRVVLLTCTLLFVLLGMVFGMYYSLVGDNPMIMGSQGVVTFDPHLRTDIVLALVTAYTFGAGLTGSAKATREFGRLRHILRLDDQSFDRYRSRLVPDKRALWIAAPIGGFIGASLSLLPLFDSSFQPSQWSWHSFPFMILLFGLLGMMAMITHRQSQVFREVGRRHIDVDLLDPDAFSPFAAVGLLNAGLWLIGSAIASLLMASGANIWIVIVVIIATTGIGVAGLIVPSRGLHTHILARKREELAEIRNAIVNERASLFSESDRSSVLPRMSDMLAYEARIESVREWPFDTSTLGRFALFLLIPLVSWIGGALVERIVDSALG